MEKYEPTYHQLSSPEFMYDDMYKIDGFDQPNMDKYLESKQKNKSQLENITFKARFKNASEEQKFNILYDALSGQNLSLQKQASELLQHISDEHQQKQLQELIDTKTLQAISSPDFKANQIGSDMLKYVSEEVRPEYSELMLTVIDNNLQTNNFLEIQMTSRMLTNIEDVSTRKDYQKKFSILIAKLISSTEYDIQIQGSKLISYVDIDNIKPLIETVLDGQNHDAKIIVAQYIKRLPTYLALPILEKIFNSNDLELKQIGADASTKLFRQNSKQPKISESLEKNISQTIQNAIISHEVTTSLVGAEMLKDVCNTENLLTLIQLGLQSEYSEVKATAIKCIHYASTSTESFKRQISEIVISMLDSQDEKILQATIQEISHLPQPYKTICMQKAVDVVQKMLCSNDSKLSQFGVKMLYYLDHTNTAELFKIVEQDTKLLNTLFFGRLYKNPYSEQKNTDQHTFPTRVKISKTGSEMTVLEGTNLEKTLLIRHIRTSNFIGWLQVFEQAQTWKEQGFDYVPIEPIQAFYIQDNTVNVYSGVFDIDLKHWLNITGRRFEQELEEKRQKIIYVLQELGVRHTDLHKGNFFLKFKRDENGHIDTQTCPRIYVGDFDKSQLKKYIPET